MTWFTGNTIVDTLSRMRQYGLEYTHRRFYSKYKGKVEYNKDPQQQGRVKVSVSDTGNITFDPTGKIATPKTLDLYAYPSSSFAGDNYGFYFPPEEGDHVWVWFDHGDPTQPHISGGWWLNPGMNPQDIEDPTSSAVSVAKSAISSNIPVEFNATTNATLTTGVVAADPKTVETIQAPEITTRGIKTKRGHGLVFEDDEITSLGVTAHGRETRVELWTGESSKVEPKKSGELPKPQVAATKRHRFVLSDALERIFTKTFRGHQTVMDDAPLTQGVRTITTGKHVFDMNDSLAASETGALPRSIMIKTTLGNMIQASDGLSPPLNSIVIFTPGNFIETALGTNTLTSTGVTAITSGTIMTLTAGGILQIVAQGVNITSSGPSACATVSGGAVNNTFTGLVTETLNGGLTQKIAGVWNMAADVVNIISSKITLGSAPAPKFYLVNENFITAYNTHSHAAPLTPPTILIVPPTSLLAVVPDPLVAPNIDRRLVLTQEVRAS